MTRTKIDPSEVDSIYVDHDSRYIVSLIVGYSDEELGGTAGIPAIEAQKQAAAAALALTTDASSSGTYWFVYDRATKESVTFEQGDLEEVFVR